LWGRSARSTTTVLPTTPGSYLGVYVRGVPDSYSPVDAFAATTGVHPNVTVYYSGWGESFRAGFAGQAAHRGAVPLVQIDPDYVKLARIAAGWYDKYLASYAAAVRRYGGPVILSFGHEMNGYWYSWSHRHTSPRTYVAAWRHMVTLFRHEGAANVTWLWTVNVIQKKIGIVNPAPWWPGTSFVTWIGIDGYYFQSSTKFAALFGPTIKAVHLLTRHPLPILISETGAPPSVGQPAKIASLFTGIRSYGLLGFVWFDAKAWRLHSKAASDTFRREAQAHQVTPIAAGPHRDHLATGWG
ncbi:MAG TPA: glycosyl hydrolase, partial [Streptosporangiaceae bacterium]|nr:glycosyl hydrolase [Streptosporangiaceae bacterium]